MDEFVRLWQELDETDKHLYIRKGEVLTKAKESIIHGEWEEFLRRIDVKKRTAQRHMRIYRVSINTPALALLNLSGTKLDQLGRLEDEQLETFLEEHGGELENITLRELTKMINAILKPKSKNNDSVKITLKISQDEYSELEWLTDNCFDDMTINEVGAYILIDNMKRMINDIQAEELGFKKIRVPLSEEPYKMLLDVCKEKFQDYEIEDVCAGMIMKASCDIQQEIKKEKEKEKEKELAQVEKIPSRIRSSNPNLMK